MNCSGRLLSWRVGVLMIPEVKLDPSFPEGQQFHMESSWFQIHNLKCLINEPTCYKSQNKQALGFAQALTIYRRVGKGIFFISLHYFHQVMNIETFICNFAFLIAPLVFTRLLLDEIYHLELPFTITIITLLLFF